MDLLDKYLNCLKNRRADYLITLFSSDSSMIGTTENEVAKGIVQIIELHEAAWKQSKNYELEVTRVIHKGDRFIVAECQAIFSRKIIDKDEDIEEVIIEDGLRVTIIGNTFGNIGHLHISVPDARLEDGQIFSFP